MIPIDELLARLEGVKPNGENRWVARCPGHADRDPSLSIGFGREGRLLLHCFGGCDIHHIATALGLEIRDLMPDRCLAPHHRLPGNQMHQKRRAEEQRRRDEIIIEMSEESSRRNERMSQADQLKARDAFLRRKRR